MKTFSIRTLVYTTLLLLCGFSAFSQQAIPVRRFAIRCNALAILNLSGVLEFECSISRRIGIFVGGGLGVEEVNPTGLAVFFKRESPYCEISEQGVYGGLSVGIPIGKLAGLSVKGIAQYTYYKAAGFGCYPDLHLPPKPDPFIIKTVRSFVGLAYTQTFLKRYFVEPLVGYGPYWTSTLRKRGITPDDWRSAMQLNIGVRF